jgi:glycosyltransferase involved in cell wall biosynthesis
MMKIPLVTTFHDIYCLKGWIKSQKSTLWGALGHIVTLISTRAPNDGIIAASPQCKQKLVSLGIPESKITIVPNGVDLKLFDDTISF